ncbi:MBL fold metallo-hydrolase [Fibrobacter sp. UWB10]|uniref:MBL fold metallo-hydrolase n=1 Tax=Fibrobacter sp. UWB10 TaxID=1896201 RepID=UPI002402FA00|nr:MBL fold metallo-hydrolase [Fibrobacter sp. UWB10]SMP45732.1 Glyoxylase, beta-lactamase superfamily II [Fibrobacter sp. UWB10]
MKKAFSPLFAVALALTVAGCSDTKTVKETAETNVVPETAAAVEGTKTVSLANGAKVTWIQDNAGEKLMPRDLFSDASDSLYASLNMPAGIPASVSTFLVQIDGKYILFDAGLGAWGGQLLNRLVALGVNPDSIGLVYLTHFHADHIAGLVKTGDAGKTEKVFKNAAVYAGKVEYDAWMNDIPKNDLQKDVMALYKDCLHLFAFGDTLPHGVLAMDAVGHTPGHTAFQLANLLVVGDLMHGYALQKDHSEINSNYDMDKAKSAESRKRLMQYARDNKLLMAGMHLPPPAFAE